MINRTRRSFTAFMLILSILLTTMPVSSVAVATVNAEALSRESQIFNYVHREVFEENAHVQRLAAEESLDSYVFLNADGSRTAYFLDEPVKFVDSSGTVREKDITLTYAANTFSTTRNNVSLQIPTNLSTGVRLSYGGYDVSIVPQGSSLTLPRRMDNSVVYDNYFGTGTKLIYTPTLDGVKEDIVLTAYRGISSFTFLLNTDGLRVFHTAEDRWYLAEYEEAEMRFWLGNVEVFDTNLKPSLGTMSVETITEGQRYRLTISADPNFLTTPATAYPVTIDPTITVSDTANGAGAIEDAPIYEGYPTSNFGSYQYNRAGYAGTTYKRGRTVVKLTGLLNNSTFNALTATNINSAIFYIWDATGTTASTVNLYPIQSNSSWTENGVTWNSISSSHFDSVYSSASVGGGNKVSFDITALVQKWKVGTFNANCGFLLAGESEGSVDRSLYASEHSTATKRPYVEFTYTCNDGGNVDMYYSTYKSAEYFRNTFWREASIMDTDGNIRFDDIYYDDGLQRRSNCYAYAFRFYYSGIDFDDVTMLVNSFGGEVGDYCAYRQIPGEFAAKEEGLAIKRYDDPTKTLRTIYNYFELASFCESLCANSAYSNEERMYYFTQLIEADAEELDYEIERYVGTAIPNASSESGKRLIALVVSEGGFHFYMQHTNNLWSHKNGAQEPSNHCMDPACNLTLTNGNIATHASAGMYANGIVHFFYISKSIADTSHSDGTPNGSTKTAILS